MKNKIILWALMVLLIVASVGAVGLDRRWWTFGRDAQHTRRVPYTASTSDLISNCTYAGADDTPLVIDDLDNDGDVEIVQGTTDAIKVIDRDCNFLDAVSIGNLDDRQPVIFDSNDCAGGKAIFLVTDSEGLEYCFDEDTGLTLDSNISLSGTVADGKGLAMDDSFGIRGMVVSNTGSYVFERVDFDTDTASTLSRGITGWGDNTVLPAGNIDNDGDLDVVTLSNVSNEVWVTDFDFNSFDVTCGSGHSWDAVKGVYDRSTTDYIMVYDSQSGVVQDTFGVYDYLGTQISKIDLAMSYGITRDKMTSKTVQLGLSGDICYTLSRTSSSIWNQWTNLVCYRPLTGAGTLTYRLCTNGYCNSDFTASDLDGDGYADFMLDRLGEVFYYDGNGSLDLEMGFGDSYEIFAIKLGSDNYRDFVRLASGGVYIYSTDYADSDYDLNLEFTDCSTGDPIDFAFVDVLDEIHEDYTDANGQVSLTGVGEGSFAVQVDNTPEHDVTTFYNVESAVSPTYQEFCLGVGDVGCGELPTCNYPCVWWDDFNYSCDFEDMGWNFIPNQPTLDPEDSKMCFNASDVGYQEAYNGIDALSFYSVVSEEFDLRVYPDAFVEHTIWYYDQNTGEFKYPYTLQWNAMGGANLQIINSTGSAVLLCTGCFTVGQEHHYKIVHYNQNTGGRAFYNTTSNTTQAVLPFTYVLQIDDNSSKTYWNIPQQDTLNYNHTNLLEDLRWGWYNDEICVDDNKIYAGEDINYVPTDCNSPDGAEGQFYCYEGSVYECDGGDWDVTYYCTGDDESGECEYGNYAVRSVSSASDMCEVQEVDECTDNPVSYSFPVLWADYFQYNDEITDRGWDGYGFVIGENRYDECDVLFYDVDYSTAEIGYDLDSPIYSDFKIEFDLWQDSNIDEDSYQPCDSDMYFYAYDDYDNLAFYVEFAQTTQDGDGYCNITSMNQTQFYDVGKWDGGAINSYKFVVYPNNKTFDFYYTTQDNPYSYLTGGTAIGWWNASSDNIKRFAWKPKTPLDTYQNGFWLDTIRVTQIEGVVPTNVTNFCDFDGCIYHDHFDYDDPVENHGWYLWNITPTNSYVRLNENPYAYFFSHNFDAFRDVTEDGIFTVQVRMMLEEQNNTLNSPQLIIRNCDYTKTPLYAEWDGGQIYDLASSPSRTVGTFTEDKWYVYSWVINLNTDTYDFYIDTSQMVDDGDINDDVSCVSKVAFHTIDNAFKIDYVTIAEGTGLVDDFADYGVAGVPSSHLKKCWDDGEFDWSCCSAEEEAEKSWGCVTRVTFLYGISSLTVFILRYVLYFIIIAIFFVLITPYIVPMLRRK